VLIRQNFDGSITELKITKADVRAPFAQLCRRAILEGAPFAPWPPDMRRVTARNYRKVTITFSYE
jgi:hypothetical protein